MKLQYLSIILLISVLTAPPCAAALSRPQAFEPLGPPIHEESAQPHLQRALAHFFNAEFEPAIRGFRRALSISPDLAEAYKYLG